jgi:hypothetical protein
MSHSWPEHPLFNEMKQKAVSELPNLGFELMSESEGHLSLASKQNLIVTLQHGGYDIPTVYYGRKGDLKICKSWGPLEYFWNKKTPVYKKYQSLKSFYDLEYELELITVYQNELEELISTPENYNSWFASIDIKAVFELLKE